MFETTYDSCLGRVNFSLYGSQIPAQLSVYSALPPKGKEDDGPTVYNGEKGAFFFHYWFNVFEDEWTFELQQQDRQRDLLVTFSSMKDDWEARKELAHYVLVNVVTPWVEANERLIRQNLYREWIEESYPKKLEKLHRQNESNLQTILDCSEDIRKNREEEWELREKMYDIRRTLEGLEKEDTPDGEV